MRIYPYDNQHVHQIKGAFARRPHRCNRPKHDVPHWPTRIYMHATRPKLRIMCAHTSLAVWHFDELCSRELLGLSALQDKVRIDLEILLELVNCITLELHNVGYAHLDQRRHKHLEVVVDEHLVARQLGAGFDERLSLNKGSRDRGRAHGRARRRGRRHSLEA